MTADRARENPSIPNQGFFPAGRDSIRVYLFETIHYKNSKRRAGPGEHLSMDLQLHWQNGAEQPFSGKCQDLAGVHNSKLVVFCIREF